MFQRRLPCHLIVEGAEGVWVMGMTGIEDSIGFGRYGDGDKRQVVDENPYNTVFLIRFCYFFKKFMMNIYISSIQKITMF
jgi:hypothetical protein